MRFLQIGKAHSKNELGFKLLAEEAKASLVISTDSTDIHEHYDLVWIPQGFYHSIQLPNAKRILFGPHNFVFPNEPWLHRFNPVFEKSIYTCLSEYNKSIYTQFGTFCMPIVALPFPVDVLRFAPDNSEKTYDCFVYFKSRSRSDLQIIENYLQVRFMKYVVVYCGKYTEEDYISILKKSKFGIWIGSHESQGFALEEALSMNVPLCVYNVKSLNDEINGDGNHSYIEYKDKYDLSATSVPYWDEHCGILFYDLMNLNLCVSTMMNNYHTFEPRKYVLENLSPKACYERINSAFDTLLKS